MVLTCDETLINSKFLYFLLFGDFLQNQMISRMGKGQYPSINSKDTGELIIPIPSMEIQKLIVSDIEKEQDIIDGNKFLIKKYTAKIKEKIDRIWDL